MSQPTFNPGLLSPEKMLLSIPGLLPATVREKKTPQGLGQAVDMKPCLVNTAAHRMEANLPDSNGSLFFIDGGVGASPRLKGIYF